MKLFWPAVATTPFQDGFHIDAICEHLQAVAKGKVKRLLINIPPRHAKTTLCCILFPAWVWCKTPSKKFLVSSYALNLTADSSGKCRRLIESPLYQKCYSGVFQLTGDQNTKLRFDNSKKGQYQATSVDSATLGLGGDLLICDDPNNIRDIHSELARQNVIDWWQSIFSQRLDSPKTGARVLIQQRSHEEDLTGWLLANEADEWCKLILPYEYETHRSYFTCIGWKDPRTKEGERLSDRLPEDEVKTRKRNPIVWSGQFQQLPAPAAGSLFKLDDFKRYKTTTRGYILDGREVFKEDCKTLCVVDLAISTKSTADYTVFLFADVTPGGHVILLHCHRERMDGPKILPKLKSLCDVYRPIWVGIEDVAFQRYFIEHARQEGLPVVSLRPETDKITRSIDAQTKCETGQLWFPEDRLIALEQELVTFPNASHDDITDTVSYLCREVTMRFRPKRPLIKQTVLEQEQEEQQRLHNFWWGFDDER